MQFIGTHNTYPVGHYIIREWPRAGHIAVGKNRHIRRGQRRIPVGENQRPCAGPAAAQSKIGDRYRAGKQNVVGIDIGNHHIIGWARHATGTPVCAHKPIGSAGSRDPGLGGGGGNRNGKENEAQDEGERDQAMSAGRSATYR
ncbi:MAG: hypothetical protein KKG09_07740 [Verrucomicrobia bacterium]|nr:hypothetical protein [Verrucomicrobiota bacterium]